MKTIRFFFLFLIGATSQAQTEKNVDHQGLFWSLYYNQLTINPKWSIHSEIDNRIFLQPVEQNLFSIRMQGRYKINENVETGVGLGYFSLASQDPENTPDFKTPEYRGIQNIAWKQNLGKTVLSQRFQIEERWIHKANKVALLPGTTYSWRFRYRLQGDYVFWKKSNQFLKALLSDELMVNFGKKIIKNTFDQNRIYAALQYGINKNIALELGYLNSFQQRSNGVDYFNRDMIRFSFIHKIKLK